MKRIISNILGTTGLSIITLSAIAVMYNGRFLCINTVFEVFAVNMLLHIALFFLNKMKFKYLGIEILTENIFVVAMLIIFGKILDWFSYVPLWILIAMGVAIYFVSLFLNLLKMQQEVKEINELIQKRDGRIHAEK